MAENSDNLVLRIMQEVRSQLSEVRSQQIEDGKRLQRVERRVDELHETAAMALGMAGHANVVVESTGQRFDEMADQIEALRRRVAALEKLS